MIYKFLSKKFYFLIILIILNINNAYSSNEIVIKVKINNEIITNVDIENEYKYLIALNKNLQKVNKDKLLKLAKQSIIKEKIKRIEVAKYFDIDKPNPYFDEVLKNFYIDLNMNSENEFKKYLLNYQLDINFVKEKLKIESMWNELIYTKYRNQIQIDEEKLRKKLKKKLLTNKNKQYKYLLSEIFFSAKNKENLDEKYKIIKDNIEKIGFENTANIYSESDSSKNAGKIGWINENQLSNLIRKEIVKINTGDVTKLINMPRGYLILKIQDKKKIEKTLDFENEFKKLITYEQNRQLNQFSTIFLSKIKNNLNVNEK